MIKNKLIWTAVVVCACVVTFAFSTAKQTTANNALSKPAVVNGVQATGLATDGVAATKTKADYNPFAGRKYVRPEGQTMSEFIAEHRPVSVNTTSDLLPNMPIDEPRDDNNSLDIICTIANGSNNFSGFLNAAEGFAFSGWINPAPSCAGSPDFPYRIDSVRFVVANAAAFGDFGCTGPCGAGTATYRVVVYNTSNCGTDSCQNPGNAIITSALVSYTTTNTAGALGTLTVPVQGCVNGPFFVSIEYVSWTGPGDNGGTGGAFRSLWPTVLWSNVARPLCEQWVFNGCSWTDHTTFFTGGTTGFYNFTVYGESNAACTPITCSNEVACDITCPGGSIQENEPACANEYVDVTNGGCFAAAENFSSIACGQTVCGTSGTFTVGGVNNSDDDFWQFTITQTTDVTLSITAEFCVLGAIIQAGPAGFECDSLVVLGSAVESPCSTLVLTGRLEAGTYWAYVSTAFTTGVPCGTPYYMSLGCELVTCIPDFSTTVSCAGASPLITGSTVGAGDPCGIGIPGELWQLTINTAGSYNFKGCDGPEVYDQRMFLFDANNCCVAFTAEDDDLCGTVGGLSFIRCVDLTPGTYFLLVSGFSAADVGQYNIAVTCCQPCPITCGDNEAEADCGPGFVGTNDGCNVSPVQVETIACGDTKCGSWGYYTRNDSGFRDLDWYRITLTEPTRLTATAQGELPNNLWITTDCPSTTISFSSAFECSTHTVSACVPAGNYYIITAPQQGLTNAPCGSKYTLTLGCEPCDIINECPAGSAVSQPVTLPTGGWTFGPSDAQVDVKYYQSYSLAPGETGVDRLTVWGLSLIPGDFTVCAENPMTFLIEFWSDSAGVPRISSNPVCTVTAQLSGDPSGLIYNDTYEALAYTYNFPPEQCCTLTSGWVSIQATSTGTPEDCAFYWGSSDLGSIAAQRSVAGVLEAQTFSMSLCLSACPPPCNPITNLTVYNAPGNAGAWLNFEAPQSATYLVYSATSPNADDNPDGGTDPDYTLEVSQPITAGPGLEQITLPVGFATYKKFVVIANCQ
ncbi:MAG: hypothetical protein IPH10_05520 [bacterium]|nr:hypothetical protein [bacterium]